MRALILVSLTMFTACGGGGGGTGTVPLDELDTVYIGTYCEKAAECCTAEELMDLTLGATSAEECTSSLGALIDALLIPALQDGIDAGRIIYHGDVIGDCTDAIDAMTCDEFANAFAGSGFTGCGDPFEGTVAIDGECGNDADCANGFCDGDSIDQQGTITYGTCLAEPGVGEPCVSFHCEDGAYCDDTNMCAAPQADGAECTNRDECASGGCNGGDPTMGIPGSCGDPMQCDGV